MLNLTVLVFSVAVCVGWWQRIEHLQRFPAHISDGLAFYGNGDWRSAAVVVAMFIGLYVDNAHFLVFILFFGFGPWVASNGIHAAGYHLQATYVFLVAAILTTLYLGVYWFTFYLVAMTAVRLALRIAVVSVVIPDSKWGKSFRHFQTHLLRAYLISRSISNGECTNFPGLVHTVHDFLPIMQWLTYGALFFAL